MAAGLESQIKEVGRGLRSPCRRLFSNPRKVGAMVRLTAFLLLGLFAGAVAAAGQPVAASVTTGSMPLDVGYRQMYNLDFDGAHKTFQGWQQSHPEDPLGPVSDAAAYLFSEFDRLHVLEVDLFTDNEKFEKRQK